MLYIKDTKYRYWYCTYQVLHGYSYSARSEYKYHGTSMHSQSHAPLVIVTRGTKYITALPEVIGLPDEVVKITPVIKGK
jgi:hypothetical protein